jgi:hypothetical protein
MATHGYRGVSGIALDKVGLRRDDFFEKMRALKELNLAGLVCKGHSRVKRHDQTNGLGMVP